MRSTTTLAALVGVLLTAACKDLKVPDLNAPSLSGLETGATRSGIATAVQGIIAESRSNAFGVVGTFGALGREGYNLDPSNPQAPANIYVNLDQNLNVGWVTAYRLLKQGNTVITSVDGLADMSTAEKEGVKGFVKSFEALGLLHLIMGLDASGAAIDVAAKATDPLPAVVAKAQVYQRIVALLDEAATHLNAAGSTFAFQLPAGFTGFNTPANFLRFNKALRARANVYTGSFTAALTDLGASFLDPTLPLTAGVYWDFSTQAGDAVNPVFDPLTRQRFAHPSFLANAQLKANLTKDNRALAKVAPITPLTRHGFPVSERLTVYNSSSAAIPIVRNEELILLRAEANLGIGTAASTLAALTDVNFIRQNAGGLDPIPGGTWTTMTAAQQLDELLYNKRYSLFWEFGTSWIDARNYGRLASLPKDRTGDVVFAHFMIPIAECDQRASNKPAGCTTRPPSF
ncbi:MAG: RagB/SusD family nutrient uptake outer membrane protein [Gemmatimonadetes bacterium]|nr:RagB/SusD family nutrient uptake outer membrane protein [Gemmatimonadota bacterium]